jgi:hypothetical protein
LHRRADDDDDQADHIKDDDTDERTGLANVINVCED